MAGRNGARGRRRAWDLRVFGSFDTLWGMCYKAFEVPATVVGSVGGTA